MSLVFAGLGASHGQAQAVDPCPNEALRTGPSSDLADCRAYELVSPSYKVAGIGVGVTGAGPGSLHSSGFAAHVGDRFAVQGSYGSSLHDDGFSNVESWSFAQRTAQGWQHHNPVRHPYYQSQVTKFISVAHATSDLSRIVYASNGAMPVFPEMANDDANLRRLILGDWIGRIELLAPTGPGQLPEGVNEGHWVLVASADGRRTAVSSPFNGMAGPGSADLDRVAGESVYVADTSVPPADSFAGTGERRLANVCTGGGDERTRLPERRADGTFGMQACPAALTGRDARLISPFGASMGSDPGNDAEFSARKGLVSADGSRTFFMSPDPTLTNTVNPAATSCTPDVGEQTACPAQLYVREENADGSATTRWISRPADGLLGSQQAELLGQAIYEGASDDGDKVFFRSNSPLTADDPNGVKDGGGNVVPPPPGGVTTGAASSDSWDLYMYDFPDAAGSDPGDGTLTRLTRGPSGGADCNIPQDIAGPSNPLGAPAAGLRFVSADGSRVYFTCAAALDGVAAPSNGTITAPGGDPTEVFSTQTNLYLYDASLPTSGRWRFVARIPRSSEGQATACASTTGIERMVQSPDQLLQSSRFTIGNCVRGTDDGSFVTFFTTGRLAADDPDEASGDIYGYDAVADQLSRLSAPEQESTSTFTCDTGLPGEPGLECYADTGWDIWSTSTAAPPSTLLGVGRDAGGRTAFFQSASRLVAEDVNDVYDVYMWRDGDLSLVSTGAADAEPALYKGNDRSGANVYLVTRDALSWQDVDAVADIYVARVDGGIPQPPDPVVCEVLGDVCQGGGSQGISTAPQTDKPGGGGNASTGVRKTLKVAGLSAKARRRAARSGVLRLRVRVNRAGRVSAVARGRIGKRTRRVARNSIQVRKAGAARLTLRLNGAAKRRLKAGRDLILSIQVRSPGARARAITVRLPGAGS